MRPFIPLKTKGMGLSNSKDSFSIPGLSVAIITHNEEKNIPGCLNSVSWSEDVVVVDDFSTDRTLEICIEKGARVFQETWKGFARQRNSAVDKTKNDWVLVLDADERVTIELAAEIRDRLETDTIAVGYRIPYMNHFRGTWIRYGGWYPDYHLRLYRKDRGSFEEREIHESPLLDGPVLELKSPLIHLAYRDICHLVEKLNSYSTLMARQYSLEGSKAGVATGLFHGMFTLFSMFILRRGFLDGANGFVLACLYACYTFLKYSKLQEMREGCSSPSA